jgi:GPH family glycoside/pentoside/hexuronide:cation symporter
LVAGPVAEPSASRLLPSLRRVIADIAFRRLLGVFVANGIAAALPATLFLFFVADVLQLKKASGPCWPCTSSPAPPRCRSGCKLSARFGRVIAWLAAMALSIVAFAGASLLGSGDLWPFAAICLASGLALGADLALPAAIAADLGERQGRPAPVSASGIRRQTQPGARRRAGPAAPRLLGYVPGSGDGLAS